MIFYTLTIHPGNNGYHENVYKKYENLKFLPEIEFSTFFNEIYPTIQWYRQPICPTFQWYRQLTFPIFHWYRQPIFPTFQWYRQLFTSKVILSQSPACEQLAVPLKSRKYLLSVPVKNRTN